MEMSNLIAISFVILCIGSGLILIALALVLFRSLYEEWADDKKDKAVKREIKRLLSQAILPTNRASGILSRAGCPGLSEKNMAGTAGSKYGIKKDGAPVKDAHPTKEIKTLKDLKKILKRKKKGK